MELYRVLQTMESHTIYYWMVLSVIGFVIIQTILVGVRFFFRKQDAPRSYFFLSLLLLAFGFTQLHFVLRILGLFELFPRIRFLPIYFTLALPVLFFYYIKTELFPGYQLRWTDTKHFLLAFGQIGYFIWKLSYRNSPTYFTRVEPIFRKHGNRSLCYPVFCLFIFQFEIYQS